MITLKTNNTSSKSGHLKQQVQRQKKSVKCSECDKFFSRKDSLQQHVTSVHKQEKRFKCTECKKTFCKKGSLTLHITSVHCILSIDCILPQLYMSLSEKSNLKLSTKRGPCPYRKIGV